MSDSRNDLFLYTKVGIIIPMVTGSISFFSSLIVITIVLRSMSGIKTIYHRIILGLSSAVCLASVAIALTTIPMPKDVIYPFQMPSYGNIATCEAQGFIFMMGNALVFGMTSILNIYYLCTLRYNMQEITFRRYLEIPLYVVALGVSIGVPSVALLRQELNPDPTDPYCVPTTYPDDCTKAENPECRGEGGRATWYLVTIVMTSIPGITLIITMTLIVHLFYGNEHKLRKAVKYIHIQEGDERYQDLLNAKQAASIITRQALLYVVAFWITWIFGLVQLSLFTEANDTLFALRMIFQPLQGFFNLIIFAYHKVYIVLKSDEDLTVTEAIVMVFLHPDKMDDSVPLCIFDFVIAEDDSIDEHAPKNSATEIDRSQVLSGFEDLIIDAEYAAQFGFETSSDFVNSEELSFIGEERSAGYKFYTIDNQKASVLPGLLRRDGNKLSPPGKEAKNGLDGSLVMISKETIGDGIAFTLKNVKEPFEAAKEALNNDDSANIPYPEAQSLFWGGAILEKYSRLNYSQTKCGDDLFARNDRDWSVGRAESFANDSAADLRYTKMKEIIDAKSRASKAMVKDDGVLGSWGSKE